MQTRWTERLVVAAITLAGTLLAGKLWAGAPTLAAAEPAEQTVTAGLVPRFIDFDIGAVTVRGGADHQDNLTDSAPYVELPNTGTPMAIFSFTVPPDYSDDSDMSVRVLWTVIDAPCFFVLEADLVGYGPGHGAATFDAYWPGSASPSDSGIITVPSSYNTHETIINFVSLGAYPGDAMTLKLARDPGNTNDTCAPNVLLRSVSVTYEGWTTYVPLTAR